MHIPRTNLFLLAAKQVPYQKKKKKPISYRKILKNFLKKVQENGQAGRKEIKTEISIGLGRKTREEIVKWNQMTTLRFHTGAETSDFPDLPSGVDIKHRV